MAVKIATSYDLPELLILAKAFVEESQWGWTFNEQNAIRILEDYLDNPETIVLLIKSDIPAGFAMLAYDDEFHDERLGYISKFYIAPIARKSGAGRMLADACVQWFDHKKCAHSFATSTANINQDKLFENLFAKKGYSICGNTLKRNEQS